MVLVAAVPLVAGTTLITKGEKGPNASAMTWEYVPEDYGIWTGYIVNTGLRSLVVDVYDNTTGVPQEIMHQRIRFAAYNAFPNGEVTTNGALMAAGHIYSITGTPNGPRGTFCTVEDKFKPAMPPVALFTHLESYLVVNVDGTSSYDPDNPAGVNEWSWNWGDMTMDSSGSTATHTYGMAGTYTITLEVTDSDGLTDTESQDVTVESSPTPDDPPVARFTPTMSWMNVSVDGSASSDDKGVITAYAWAWGDTTTGSGETATHRYATPGMYTITLTVTDTAMQTGTASAQVEAKQAPPVASFTSSVNKRDVSVDASGSSDADGTVTAWAWNWGDNSALGSGKTATHLYASIGTFTITLTVTDNDGLIGISSKQVTTSDSPPTASFTVSVNGLVVNVNAAGSSDDYGIVSYVWNWGDGTSDSGSPATHTYASTPPAAPKSLPSADGKATPPPPFLVFGQTKDSLGNVIPECAVMITNMRTGSVNYTTSDALYGYYEFNLNDQIGGVADLDMIKVTATKGAMTGEVTGQALNSVGFVYLEVVLTAAPLPPYDVTITLTVTDGVVQTASVSKVVTITP